MNRSFFGNGLALAALTAVGASPAKPYTPGPRRRAATGATKPKFEHSKVRAKVRAARKASVAFRRANKHSHY